MLEVVCRQGRGTLTQGTEAILGTLVDELESTLLPGSTVSADRAGVPSGDGGYGVGHHASCPVCSSCCCGNELHGGVLYDVSPQLCTVALAFCPRFTLLSGVELVACRNPVMCNTFQLSGKYEWIFSPSFAWANNS